MTPAQAEAAAWRLWELVGDEEQKLSVNDCRHIIVEVISAAGLRMGGGGECGGETSPGRDDMPRDEPGAQERFDLALRHALATPPKRHKDAEPPEHTSAVVVERLVRFVEGAARAAHGSRARKSVQRAP